MDGAAGQGPSPTGRARRVGCPGEGGGQSTGCRPRGRGPGTAPFLATGRKETAKGAEGDPPPQQKGRTGSVGGQPAARGGRVAGGCWAEASATLQPGPRASRPLPGSLARCAVRLDQHQLTADPHLPRPALALTGGAGCTLHADSGHAASCPSRCAAHGRARGRGGSRGAAGSCRVQDPTVQVPD